MDTIHENNNIPTTDKVGSFKSSNFMKRLFPSGFKFELLELIKFSWPAILCQFFSSIIRTTITIFVGHLGKLELGGATMAITLITLFGNSIGIGMLSACETYFSQSYGSANKFQVGIYVQTAFYVSTLSCLISASALVNTQSILLGLGQNPIISLYAEQFMLIFAFSLPFISLYQLLMRYLIMQSVVLPPVVAGLVANVLHVLSQYLFVDVLNLRLRGSAVAMFIGYSSMASVMLLYTYCSKVYRKTWAGWSKYALLEWGVFLKYGIYGILMSSLEWWAFDVCFFLMGILGPVDLDASSILFQIWAVISSFAKGAGSACAYKVGLYMGSSNIEGAITVTRVSLIMSCFVAIIFAILILVLRSYLPFIFTSDADVVALSREMLPLLALFCLLGVYKEIAGGIVRGIGMLARGGLISFITYFVFAIPIGVPLMFYTSLRASGFWWGLVIGVLISTILLTIILMTANWSGDCEKAQKIAKCKKKLKTEPEKTKLSGSWKQHNSYGSIEYSMSTSAKHTPEYWRRLIVSRVLIVLICVMIFIFGLLCRFVIFIPKDVKLISNVTDSLDLNATVVLLHV